MIKSKLRALLLGIFITSSLSSLAEFQVVMPNIIVDGTTQEIVLLTSQPYSNPVSGEINGMAFYAEIENGKAIIPFHFNGENEIYIEVGNFYHREKVDPIPLWLSIIPPLLAIILALAFKEVMASLFIGIVSGSVIIACYSNGLILGILYGLMDTITTYLMGALNDWDHLAIILFSTLIGGMVAVVSKNGGMQGIVAKLSIYAKNAKSSQVITWFLGVIIFFDDYANTLIVGNTMRPLTDRFKVSREKLSYIVDSTAAPMAAIAFVTTWIGAELGYINDGISQLSGINESAYSIFLHSLQYSFYPVMTLAFVLMLILKGKDFGPMLTAEVNARHNDLSSVSNIESAEMKEFIPEEGVKLRWYNAAIPVLVLIFGTIGGLIYTGMDSAIINDPERSFISKVSGIIGNSNSYEALLWSSLLALITAVFLSIYQKIMSLKKTMDATMNGFKTMLNAVVILVLAWSLSMITKHMYTATFITSLLSDNVSVYLIPAITFILAALVAFSTGSSWGTMAILYPLMLPACWSLSMDQGVEMAVSTQLFYNVVSSVLAGSVLGDHCSPISDTTILSSLASSCDHIEHVRTQLPYALTVGVVSICIGTIPSSFGLPPWIAHILGIAILYIIINKFGKIHQTVQPISKQAS